MKKQLGGVNVLYPSLTILCGAMVNGRPNFNTIAHVGIMNHAVPHCISLGMAKVHYTNQGIKEAKTFSVNIPDESLMVETDYCGLVSGRNTDKAVLFDVFYGETRTAPMIAQCRVNMECRLRQVVDFPTHDVFVGEVVQTWADESVLRDMTVDVAALRPLLFDMGGRRYWSLGEPLGLCWSEGRAIESRAKAGKA